MNRKKTGDIKRNAEALRKVSWLVTSSKTEPAGTVQYARISNRNSRGAGRKTAHANQEGESIGGRGEIKSIIGTAVRVRGFTRLLLLCNKI